MTPREALETVVPFSLILLGWLALHETRSSRMPLRSWRHVGWFAGLAAVSLGGFMRFLSSGGALSSWNQTGMLVQAVFNGAVAVVVGYRWLRASPAQTTMT